MNSDQIKEQFTMRDIVTNRYGFRIRRGFIKCPFHKGDNSASLKIYDRSFYCFGCGVGGDIFKFVQEMEGCSFKDAFLLLGGEYKKKQKQNKSLIAHNKRARQQQINYENEKQLRNSQERKKCLREIELYRFIKNHSKPLSDRWCNAVNKLQYLFQKLEGAENYR